MPVEETADKILLRLFEDKVPQKDIHNEFPDYFDSIQLLKKDGFIGDYFWPQISRTKFYRITPKGKAFVQSGGYKTIQEYQRNTLNIAKASRDYALWALIISAASVVVTLILWILGRGK